MDISSLSTLFTAPAISDAKPAEKKGNDDSICTRILNAVKSALAFFVSCLTCGKVKVFEANPQNPAKPLPPPPQAKSPLENQIEAAAKAAKIDQTRNGHELQAFIFMSEIFEKVCAPGEHLQITSSQDHVLTLALPESLSPLARIISYIAHDLVMEYKDIFEILQSEYPEGEDFTVDYNEGPTISFVFRRKSDQYDQINFPKAPGLIVTHDLCKEMNKHLPKELHLIERERIHLTPQNSDLIAAGVIYKLVNGYRDSINAKIAFSEHTPPGLYLTPVWEHKSYDGPGVAGRFDLCKQLLKHTWNTLRTTLGGPVPTAQIVFSYDEHRNALILDQSRLTTR